MAVRCTLACRHFRLASPASAVAPPDAAVQQPPPVMMPSATATGGARAERLIASSAPVLNDSTLAALRERSYAVVENFLSLDKAAALRIDASEARPVVEPLGQAFNAVASQKARERRQRRAAKFVGFQKGALRCCCWEQLTNLFLVNPCAPHAPAPLQSPEPLLPRRFPWKPPAFFPPCLSLLPLLFLLILFLFFPSYIFPFSSLPSSLS